MRRSEFIKAMEEYDLEVKVENNVVKVRKNNRLVAEVFDSHRYVMGTYNDIMKYLNDDIVRYITNYACTPLYQRDEPEKKYKYKLNVPDEILFNSCYLNKSEGKFKMSTQDEIKFHQTIFTRKEVAHLDLSMFEEIEVK